MVQMVNGKLVVSKQCGSYRDCLLRERDNYRRCNVSHSGPVTSMQCTFCCTGTGCNQGDLGGQSSVSLWRVASQAPCWSYWRSVVKGGKGRS